TESIPHKKLTPDNLAAAIHEVTTNPSIRQNAEALGAKIRAENGVANTVDLIESMVAKPESEAERVLDCLASLLITTALLHIARCPPGYGGLTFTGFVV
ncbi:MAG: hypothetical protein KC519_17725, partial [Anaerolineae bacterium]|nr:hypothetical protein [Anaerolineae bacterium]